MPNIGMWIFSIVLILTPCNVLLETIQLNSRLKQFPVAGIRRGKEIKASMMAFTSKKKLLETQEMTNVICM